MAHRSRDAVTIMTTPRTQRTPRAYDASAPGQPYIVSRVDDEALHAAGTFCDELATADAHREPARHDTAAAIVVIAHTESDARAIVNTITNALCGSTRPDLVTIRAVVVHSYAKTEGPKAKEGQGQKGKPSP
jgi:hypothetical protein